MSLTWNKDVVQIILKRFVALCPLPFAFDNDQHMMETTKWWQAGPSTGCILNLCRRLKSVIVTRNKIAVDALHPSSLDPFDLQTSVSNIFVSHVLWLSGH